RFFGGTLSTAAPLTLRRFSAASAAGSSRPGTGVGFGTSGDPFSALRYRDIQGRLSHATLAQRVLRGRGLKQWSQVAQEGPHHLVVVDEVADLFGADTQCVESILKLVQKGRAAGIGVILCSQYPRENVISS